MTKWAESANVITGAIAAMNAFDNHRFFEQGWDKAYKVFVAASATSPVIANGERLRELFELYEADLEQPADSATMSAEVRAQVKELAFTICSAVAACVTMASSSREGLVIRSKFRFGAALSTNFFGPHNQNILPQIQFFLNTYLQGASTYCS